MQEDRFVWRWSADGKYSASFAYRAFFVGSTSLLGAKELWKAKAPPRVKFFFWLALHCRLWTADRRVRHGLQEDDTCVLCAQGAETTDHLFVGCVFAREFWFFVLRSLGTAHLLPSADSTLVSWWLNCRHQLDIASRPQFDSIVLLVSWTLWKERNNRTFDRSSRGPMELLDGLCRELDDWIQAGFTNISVLGALLSQHLASM